MNKRHYTKLHRVFGADFIIYDISLKIEYIDNVENNFRDYKANFSHYLDNQFSDKLEGYSFKSSMGAADVLCKNQYESNYREGLFFQIYTFIEDSLMVVCQRCSEYFNLSHVVEDLRGSTNLDAIGRFLAKFLLVDFSIVESEWEFIQNLKSLWLFQISRNRFGKYDTSEQQMEKLRFFSENRYSIIAKNLLSQPNIHFSESIFLYEMLTTFERFIYKIGEHHLPDEIVFQLIYQRNLEI